MNESYRWKDKPIDCLIKEKSKLEIDVKSEQWKDKDGHKNSPFRIQELKELIEEYDNAIMALKRYAKELEGDRNGGKPLTEKGR